jgi:hypothetical protein
MVRFERTIQVAQYEPKKAAVELSFVVTDGDTHTEIARQAALEAITLTENILRANVVQAPAPSAPVERKPKPAAEPDINAGQVVKDPASVEEIEEPKPARADPAAVVDEAPVVKEIPDKTLVDACSKTSKETQNSEAIRALISEYVAPPGRVANIKQEKRQEFLDRLGKIEKAND